jgi:hypothetical protein
VIQMKIAIAILGVLVALLLVCVIGLAMRGPIVDMGEIQHIADMDARLRTVEQSQTELEKLASQALSVAIETSQHQTPQAINEARFSATIRARQQTLENAMMSDDEDVRSVANGIIKARREYDSALRADKSDPHWSANVTAAQRHRDESINEPLADTTKPNRQAVAKQIKDAEAEIENANKAIRN